MEKLSVYDAKARFSELMERAESGRSTVITERGRVVARIVPARGREWDRSAVLNAYDATYLALSLELRLPIACGDRPLKAALRSAEIKLA